MTKKSLEVYLVSDSSGETVIAVSRATLVQFPNYDCKEHQFFLVRTKEHVDAIISEFSTNPGIIIYTMGNGEVLEYFLSLCHQHGIPAICPIDSTVSFISEHINTSPSDTKPGKYRFLDKNYYAKINNINYAINHDDGQNTQDYSSADIVLLGVSRTSKSPTSLYLSQRGYNVANYPIVHGLPVQIQNFELMLSDRKPMFIGLTISERQLEMIRNCRISVLCAEQHSLSKPIVNRYSSSSSLKEEVEYAMSFFREHSIPVVNVTNKAIEEVAAEIINMYNRNHH